MSDTFQAAAARPSEVALSPDGSKLYSAGADGILRVYSAKTGALINSWQVGTKLGGLDLSPDGSFLMVVERQPLAGGWQSQQTTITVYKVDTATGQTTSYPYQATGLDYVFFDVAVLSDGKVLLSQDFAGSGWTALKLLDPATGLYTSGAQVRQSSVFTPTQDGAKVFVGEPNISDGRVDIYQTGTGLVAKGSGNGFNWGIQAFANSGSLAANYIYNEGILIYNSALQLLTTLRTSGDTDWRSGRVTDLAFDPSGQYLFVLDNEADAIVQLRTSDWSVVRSTPVNADVGSWAGVAGASFGSRLIVDPLGRYFSVATDSALVLVANPNAPAMEGTSGIDVLHGTLFDDVINGHGDGDFLYGGPGADTLAGGAGDDQYYVYSADSATFEDVIIELPGGGYDQIRTTLPSFSLAAHPEIEMLYGIANISFTLIGNDRDNYIIGDNSADTLEGGLGNDKLQGRGGDDTMRGGLGDDEYVIEDIGDVVEENIGEGKDKIWTSLATYSLVGTHVENLSALSSVAHHFEGNDGNNVIFGGNGDDQLLGLGGADELYGGEGTNSIHGGDGDDFLYSNAFGIDTIEGGAGNDVAEIEWSTESRAFVTFAGGDVAFGNLADTSATLTGVETIWISTGSGADSITTLGGNDEIRTGAGNDYLNGSGGNDYLNGGAGADSMVGGAGNDVYVIDDAGDVVTESSGEGTDQVRTGLGAGSTQPLRIANQYQLGANVENLTGTGLNQGLRGNALNNAIAAGSGSDFINLRDGGDDTVTAGDGRDVLYYGAALTSADSNDAGAAGGDVRGDLLILQGDYSDGVTLGPNAIAGVEKLRVLRGNNADFGDAAGNHYSYEITTVDSNVARDGRLVVQAGSLRVGETLSFDGSDESDGSFQVFGGRDGDRIEGGAQFDHLLGRAGDDELIGNGGDDRLRGGLGQDSLDGGAGADILVYSAQGGAEGYANAALESTSAGYDILIGFDYGEDRIDLPNAITGLSTDSTGKLDSASFDSDLASALGSFQAGSAVLFTPDSGDLATRHFLVVDANGDGSYQANLDFVFELQSPVGILPPTPDFFI